MNRLLFFICFCFWLTAAPALALDSLWGVWNDTSQVDSNRLNAMQLIIRDKYIFAKPDSAFYFAQMQYDLAEENGQKKHMADALNLQGVSYAIRGINHKAIESYNRSLKIFEKMDNKAGIATAIMNMGIMYSKQEEKEKALDHYTKSLMLFEEINNKSGAGAALINMGTIYFDRKNLEKAMEFFVKSLKVKEEVGHKKGIATSLANIGEVYSAQGNISKAMEYYQRGLAIYIEINAKNKIAESYLLISKAYKLQGEYSKTIAFTTKALKIAQEMGSPGLTENASKLLHESYKHIGDTRRALEMHELYLEAKDNITNEENTKAIIQLQYKYEYEKKSEADSIKNAEMQKVKDAQLETQQVKLKQERLMRYGLIAISSLVIILLINLALSHRNYKRQQEAETEKLLSQIKLLKTDNALRKTEVPLILADFEINKEKLNALAENRLNESDWKILNEICNHPTIANKDIAASVYLSLEGVKSSFKKMYDLFEITASGRNKKLALAIHVMKISEGSLEDQSS